MSRQKSHILLVCKGNSERCRLAYALGVRFASGCKIHPVDALSTDYLRTCGVRFKCVLVKLGGMSQDERTATMEIIEKASLVNRTVCIDVPANEAEFWMTTIASNEMVHLAAQIELKVAHRFTPGAKAREATTCQ